MHVRNLDLDWAACDAPHWEDPSKITRFISDGTEKSKV